MRYRDSNWNIPEGKDLTWEHASVAVLMDLRDELKGLRQLILRMVNILECPNFTAIPSKLDRITVNTQKMRKRKRKKVGSRKSRTR
jgi:hypothetical protein